MITTTLGENLQTVSVLDGKNGSVRTAYFDPREDMQPGEVLASALGACMLTMIGYAAQKRGEDVTGTTLSVASQFGGTPRRVVSVKLVFTFKDNLSGEQKNFYTHIAQTCPVHNSLREDVEYKITVK